jgi:DNA-binding beta-propeller fold protein YncE
VYVADTNNHLIRRFDMGRENNGVSNGGMDTVAGVFTGGRIVNNPNTVSVFDPLGRVLSGDDGDIGDGNYLVDMKGGYNGDGNGAQLNYPRGISFDSNGALYIADTNNQRIRKLTARDTLTTVLGGGLPTCLVGGNGEGYVFVQEEFSYDFPYTRQDFQDFPTILPKLNYPRGVSVDQNTGALYIADTGNNRITLVAPNGNIITVAGNAVNGSNGFSGDGGKATNALLNGPNGVFVDATGKVFIADSGNNRVRKFDVEYNKYTQYP